jgi:hypothetical protein
MKRVLAALLFLAASTVHGQIIDFAYHLTASAYPLDGGLAGTGSSVGPYSGTPVLGDIICFDGTNWVSIAAGATTQFLGANTGACPTYQALPASGGSVTLQASSPGTPDVGNWSITGVGDVQHDAVGATLTPGLFLSNTTAALVGTQQQYSPSLKFCGAGWNTTAGGSSKDQCWQIMDRPQTGATTSSDIAFFASVDGGAYANVAYINSAGKLTLGNSGATDGQIRLEGATSGDITFVPTTGALGTKTITVPAETGTLLTSASFPFPNSSGGIGSSPCTPSPVQACIWEEFMQQSTGISATANVGNIGIACTGTAATIQTPTVAADGNHPGVIEVNAGTSAGSGVCAARGAMNSGSAADSIVFGTTAATVEWEADMQTASGGTNTAKVYFGFGDTVSTADLVDGAAIYWDNNADTHWGCETAANSVRTATLSTNVASTGWHKFNVSVNAAGTSVTFKVDGSALSCSPLATNIPTGNTRGTSLLSKIVQTAGAAGLLLDWDYVWYSQAVTR